MLSSEYSEHETLECFGSLADYCESVWIAGILLSALHHYKDIVKPNGSVQKFNILYLINSLFLTLYRLISQWTLFQLCCRSLCLSNWIYQWDRQASFQIFFHCVYFNGAYTQVHIQILLKNSNYFNLKYSKGGSLSSYSHLELYLALFTEQGRQKEKVAGSSVIASLYLWWIVVFRETELFMMPEHLIQGGDLTMS